MPENPIHVLLQTKERRDGREFLALAVCVAAGLGLVQSHVPGPPVLGLLVVLGCTWLLHVVVIPTLIRPGDTSLLVTFRRGRCLPDLAGAGLGPRDLVDGLALHAFRSPLALGVALTGLVLLAMSLPPGSRQDYRELAVALSFALYPVLRVAGSYAAQMLAAWSGDSERVNLPQLLLALAVHGVANVILVYGMYGVYMHEAGALMMAAAVLYLALASRAAALAGLRRQEPRQAARPRTRLRLPNTVNPVVARELVRDVANLPGGAPALLALNLLSLPALGLWLETGGRTMAAESGTVPALVEVPLLGLLLLGALRAASRSLDGCLGEREARTLDLVASTRMTPMEWLDGMALVGWVPRALETGLALLVLAMVWHLSGVSSAAPLLLGFTVMAAMPLASYLAILCFPTAGSRRAAAILAYMVLLGVLWFGVLLAATTGAAGSPMAAGSLLVSVLVATMAARDAAERTMLAF